MEIPIITWLFMGFFNEISMGFWVVWMCLPCGQCGLPDGKDPSEASGDQRLVGALGKCQGHSPVGEKEISTIEAANKRHFKHITCTVKNLKSYMKDHEGLSFGYLIPSIGC